jgi:hypothetical protein
MPYTSLQKLRRARAKNKGTNRRMARWLRTLAGMFDKKGPEEFSRKEIEAVQAAREMLTNRLYMNAVTKHLHLLVEGKIPKVNGKYKVTLSKRDL